jgi:ATP-dependent Clp protease ATP-binding subunit ClpC
MLDKVVRRLRPQHIEVTFTDEAVAYLSERGFDPDFGARPLKRTIQRLVENELSRMILDGSLNEGDAVAVGLKDEKLTFDVKKSSTAKASPEKKNTKRKQPVGAGHKSSGK